MGEGVVEAMFSLRRKTKNTELSRTSFAFDLRT